MPFALSLNSAGGINAVHMPLLFTTKLTVFRKLFSNVHSFLPEISLRRMRDLDNEMVSSLESRMLMKMITLLIGSYCFSMAAFAVSEISPELAQKCALAGGRAKIFSSGCTNTCYYEQRRRAEGHTMDCPMVVTADCDCGPDKCLENTVCVPYSKSIHQDTKHKTHPIAPSSTSRSYPLSRPSNLRHQ
jgi:hypothetical protein